MQNAIVSFLLVLGFTLMAFAFSSGPPDGLTTLTNNCTNCHGSFSVNSGNGSLNLIGLPAGGYTPGEIYPLAIQLDDPDQSRWGFELTSYLNDNQTHEGGTLEIVQGNTMTQLSNNTGTDLDYLKHTSNGTFQGVPNGPVAWPFLWTAPVSGSGSVTFEFAGNAANGNGSTGGDYIYVSSTTVTEIVNSVKNDVTLNKTFELISAYPNPFNPTTTLRVKAPVSGLSTLAVYNMSGQLVRKVYEGFLDGSVREFGFDGSGLSSGIYIARLSGNGYSKDAKLVLMK